MTKTFILVDAMSLAYRSHFAFISNPLINSKGQNVSVLHGFITGIFNLFDQYKPDYFAIVFDRAEPTFRHKIYPDYKATRNKMPDDMSEMLPILKNLLIKMEMNLIELAGFEADDIIGTISKRFSSKDVNILMSTIDKDYMQLVDENVKIIKSVMGGFESYGILEVKNKFGVSPNKVIEVLGLMGDSSDNIPGVKGIGEKTAIPLIQKYDSIENLYKHIDEIQSQSVKNKLSENKKMAELSRELVTIHTDVPIKLSLNNFEIRKINKSTIAPLLSEMELRSVSKRIEKFFGEKIKNEVEEVKQEITEIASEKIDTILTTKHKYNLIDTDLKLNNFITELKKQKEFVFDTETTSLDPYSCKLVGISFSWKISEAYYIPISQSKSESEDLFGKRTNEKTNGFEVSEISKKLKNIFQDSSIKKIGQNIKFDALVLLNNGIETNNLYFDTLIASFILKNNEEHSLDALALKYLNYETISFSELIGNKKNSILDIPTEKISDYSCEDADVTFRLYKIFIKKINESDFKKLVFECELPLLNVILKMETFGIKLDLKMLAKMGKMISSELKNLEEKIISEAGENFNVNSTQQLGKILFEKLKLPIIKKTKTGFSTDMDVLERLKHQHKIIDYLLEYRILNKLLSTYVNSIPELVNEKSKKIHSSFSQTIASTGRLSSSNPNFQNIPIRTEIGREIRKAFIPSEKENKIVSADYSQIELRIFAHFSNDKAMCEAFKNGEDIHSTTAQKVFGVDENSVTKEMRRRAKEVNFGLIYGIGVFGLARNLEITQNESKEIITKYFARFPGVKKYMDETLTFAKSHGYVETLLKRRRYLPDINSQNRNVRQNAERQAINMPIQGTAADMIKLAMISIDNEIEKRKLKSRMILQVHDELVFDVPKNELSEIKILIAEKMESAISLDVPIVVDIGVGNNWLEAHD